MRRLIERLARARLAGRVPVAAGVIAIAIAIATSIVAAVVVACGSPPPRITFTEIPSAALGGPIRTATIAGRVDGARPGDRIVLYAKSGAWYVQPLRTNPFTAIDAQGLWRSTIHLGTEYAAIVVREDYRPPNTAKVLPDLSSHVLAIATVNGRGDHVDGPAAPLQFSGYEWEVRERVSDRGGRNLYAAANASVDADGALHLKLARREDQRREDQWTSAGACLTRALGYGTYVFIVRDMAGLDPAARLALFTFDENARAEHFREMNIDLWRGSEPSAPGDSSNSGDSSDSGGQFVLQPNYLPGNLHRFSVPGGRVSHTMRWEPGVVAFKSMRGNFLEQPGAAIASRTFTTGVPGPGDERVCMAFYFYRKGGHEPRADSEMVIERFQYLP